MSQERRTTTEQIIAGLEKFRDHHNALEAEVMRLKALLAHAAELLQAVEWVANPDLHDWNPPWCPWCKTYQEDANHAPDCPRAGAREWLEETAKEKNSEI